MNRESEPSAAEQLAAFENAQREMTPVAKRGAKQLGMLCVSLGLVLGALHGLLHVYHPERSLTAFFILVGAAVLASIALSFGYLKVRSVLPRGLSKAYLLSLFASYGIYAITLTLITTPMAAFLVVLLGVAVALPLLLGGVWMMKR